MLRIATLSLHPAAPRTVCSLRSPPTPPEGGEWGVWGEGSEAAGSPHSYSAIAKGQRPLALHLWAEALFFLGKRAGAT